MIKSCLKFRKVRILIRHNLLLQACRRVEMEKQRNKKQRQEQERQERERQERQEQERQQKQQR